MTPIRTLLAAAALAAASTAGMAHGDAHAPSHAKAHAADAAAEATAFGQPGERRRVSRTIRVAMRDTMRFEPAQLSIRRGETVRFVVANKGAVLHEMVLGTPEDLASHAELMKKHPGMEHDAPSMVHVKPGQAGDIVWTFTQPGTFQFACLIPGHFEAGMVGTLTVK